MFESLSDRLSKTLKSITGQARLTEDNIKDTLREVRRALLEADVALPVVKAFIERVRERAVGQEVSKSLSPGQQFVKIVQQELEAIMGEGNVPLELKTQPSVILMAGLQGAGKTTSVAKLARFLREREKKKVLVVSADVYRPAAIDQLDEEGPGPLLHPLWEGRGVVGDLAGRLWALATWGDPLAKELVPQVRATISLAAWCELGARISRERTQLFDR